MKKIATLVVLLVIAGCLFPAPRSMRAMVSSLDEYTVTIKNECDATQLRTVMPETASLFVEFGCDSCLVADFRKGGAQMTVELVSFLKSRGAMGAYLSTDIPGSEPASIGLMGRQSDTAVEFLKGRFIVQIRSDDTNSMRSAVELARLLEKQLPGDTIKPDVYEMLPRTQLVDGSQFYFAGAKGFSLGFKPELADVLNIGGAVEGAAAEYDVDGVKAVFMMVRYVGRGRTLSALNSYLNSRQDRPIIRPGESLQFFTVIEPDRTESYIAENGDWLYLLMNGPENGKAEPFFSYVLRGGR